MSKINAITKFTSGKFCRFSDIWPKDFYQLLHEFARLEPDNVTPRYTNFYSSETRQFIRRLWWHPTDFIDENNPLQPSKRILNVNNRVYHNIEQPLINQEPIKPGQK